MALKITYRNVVRVAAFIGAAALIVIGIRFLLWPAAAASFFGMGFAPATYEYHYAIALRDLWLGLLLAALAWRQDWWGIAVWFGLATLVCASDSAIAFSASGQVGSVAFHLACAALSAIVAALAWREHMRWAKRKVA